MSTQIDPLTGLPMVFDNIIEQIPLDAQIFPYADLGATARPTAPPLYPDSIIPVSAFLSGQHPDTGSAQTVETDGNHALLVKDTGGASGGTPIYVDAQDLTINDNRELVPTTDVMWTFTATDYDGLYFAGLLVNVTIWPHTTPPASGQTTFHFYYGSGGFNPWLLHGSIAYGVPIAGLGNTSWSGSFIPPVPINLKNSMRFPGDDIDFVFTCDGTIDLNVSSTFKFLKVMA